MNLLEMSRSISICTISTYLYLFTFYVRIKIKNGKLAPEQDECVLKMCVSNLGNVA